jgi:hypothetical protein
MKRVELERDTQEELAKKQEHQIDQLRQQIILVSMQAAEKEKSLVEEVRVLTTLRHESRSRSRTPTTSQRSRSVSPRSRLLVERALSTRLGSGASAVSFERTASNRPMPSLMPPKSSSARRSASPGRRMTRGSSSALRACDRRPQARTADMQVTRMKLVQK